MGSELKPCPFCLDGDNLTTDGGAISEYGGRSHMDVWVECATCGCEGPKDYDTDPDIIGYADTAIAAWNTRPKQAGVTEASDIVDPIMAFLAEQGHSTPDGLRDDLMFYFINKSPPLAAIDAEGDGTPPDPQEGR